MNCFTDYPLFDENIAPIRKVEFISYDGNKYCKIKFAGKIFEVKGGYLYSEERRLTMDYSPKPFDYKIYKPLDQKKEID